MIIARTDENGKSHVMLDGSGKVITAELCATIASFADTASMALGVPKSKAYESILTTVAEILAKSLEKKNAAE